MAETKPKVRSYRAAVVVKIKKATDEELSALALQIGAQTRVNIQDNGQIDTGFMLNSVYEVLADGTDTFDDTDDTGEYFSLTGDLVTRRRADKPILPAKARAAVGVGASYAIYQETDRPFLYPAAESAVAGRPGAEVKNNIKRKVREAK